jgi:hypothetical protein
MKTAMWIAVVLSASFAGAQSDSSKSAQSSKAKGQVTVRGCVTMLNGDYVLTKQDPANTYQLEKASRIRLKSYLGQRVEIKGTKSTTEDTSEDAINNVGNASPVTIRIKSIKMLAKECPD